MSYCIIHAIYPIAYAKSGAILGSYYSSAIELNELASQTPIKGFVSVKSINYDDTLQETFKNTWRSIDKASDSLIVIHIIWGHIRKSLRHYFDKVKSYVSTYIHSLTRSCSWWDYTWFVNKETLYKTTYCQ